MNPLINIAIVLSAFIAMEGVAWLTHKVQKFDKKFDFTPDDRLKIRIDDGM